LGKSKSKGARVPASRVHQAYVEKTMQSRMISPDRHSETRPKTVPHHDDFLTMLICGRELESDLRLKHFDKVVFHDDVAQIIQVYPEL
jgi:hypothetical protein